jgi:tRNA pseudouridine38-40 synthase
MRPFDQHRAQLLVRFGYDGGRFRGLQPQAPGIPTAGAALKERLSAAAGQPPKGLNFAARTDAGVHALKNLATCYFRDPAVDVAAVIAHVQAPRDDGLVDVRAFRVPPTVHARGSGRGKRYRYLVEDGAVDTDPQRPWVWAVAPSLDGDRMRAAATRFVGTHDFSSLRAADCAAESAEKTLASVRVGGPFVVDGVRRRFVIEVCGTAFLRKMMRNIVGVIVEVGAGLREPSEIDAVLAARSRQAAGVCAPPQGLVLVEVGCAWPDDGSLLIKELRGLSSPSA